MGRPPETVGPDGRAIERALSRGAFAGRFEDRHLEADFAGQITQGGRLHNRIAIALLVILFDLFWFGEIHASPEVLALSAWLRFVVLTPLVALYFALEWRGRLRGWQGIVIPGLIIAPNLLAAIECHFITSPGALVNFQAVPLMQLAVLTCRVSLRQAYVTLACGCLIYAWITFTGSFVPHGMTLSLLLSDISITVAAAVVALRLDYRDRQIFLFRLQSDLRRAQLAAQNEVLARLSQIDALTGLGNRRCFDDGLERLWVASRAQQTTLSLVLFDIDHFKHFNDSFGHQAGDECLRRVARAVEPTVRGGPDTLARYGGEEFAMLLPDTGLDAARAIAERVRLAVLGQAIPHGGVGLGYLTISLGVASVSPDTENAAQLVEMADRCLYEAKRRGRNQVAIDCPAPALAHNVVSIIFPRSGARAPTPLSSIPGR